MPPISPTFNPAQVMLNSGQPGAGRIQGPYVPTKPVGPVRKPGGENPIGTPFLNPQPFSGKIGGGGWAGPQSQTPQSTGGVVRATGTGPYDAAYRQNLATYAGGLFSRPQSGVLSFNPTDPNSLQGTPTGGGSAPVQGMPTSLLAQALGTSALPQGSYTNPSPSQSATSNTAPLSNPNIQNWLQNFMQRYMYQGSNQ